MSVVRDQLLVCPEADRHTALEEVYELESVASGPKVKVDTWGHTEFKGVSQEL